VRRCAEDGKARAGSVLRLRGQGLQAVKRVIFHGGPSAADDMAVRVRPRGPRRLGVRVPADAVTGPISIWAERLPPVRTRRTLEIVAPETEPKSLPTVGAPAQLRPVDGPSDPGAPSLETGLSRTKAFFGAQDGVAFSYRVAHNQPVSVQVQLVRTRDGDVVQSWDAPSVPAGQAQTVVWKGTAGGAEAAEGRYAFRATASGSGGAKARSSQVTDVTRDAFDFYGHIFPVRGRHDYGQSGARFGAGRSGRGHQGQDVFATCGTPMVVARGGVVQFKQYHAAAGHYLVIDGDETDFDYAYMHLQSASPLRVGQRVYTGQPLGTVGDSGNASGCHLHFEMWGAPGWYDGGKPTDPFPHLRSWDSGS